MDTRERGLSAIEKLLVSAVYRVRRFNRHLWNLHARLLMQSLGSCGVGVRIQGPIRITDPSKVFIGHNVHIGENAFISSEGGLVIGDNTHISRNLVLYTINHQYKQATLLPYDSRLEKKPVTIGRNVWIGMNVCVAPGTTIGDGVIIALGTVVSGTIPPLTIVGNQKWRVLGYRDLEHYQQLETEQSYGSAGIAADIYEDAPSM